jgi:hypothetical protein
MSTIYSNLSKLFQKTFGVDLPQLSSQPAQINTEISCFILGENSTYFKYFLAKEDEKKDNLILLYDGIHKRREVLATAALFSYNFAKSILWRRGYFAYFFYHTRLMSLIIYFLSLYLIKLNFNAHLLQDDLLRYYEKRKSFNLTKTRIDNFIAKKESLKKINADNYQL